MKKYALGDHLNIHSYKHNGKIHRSWDEATFLEETDEFMVFGNNRTLVIESDGRTWKTKEPAIMFFSKKNWFNIIGQIKKTGIYYYCNIASPFVIEESTIKYIDYDLDLRVFPDGGFKILDRNEYNYHKKIMHYTEDIDKIVNASLQELIQYKKENKGPFDPKVIEKYKEIYTKYEDLN